MVSHVTRGIAEDLAEQIGEIEGVSSASLGDSIGAEEDGRSGSLPPHPADVRRGHSSEAFPMELQRRLAEKGADRRPDSMGEAQMPILRPYAMDGVAGVPSVPGIL